jgi:hypothetical protein
MKTAIKRKNDNFLVKPLKLVNRSGTPKLWAISHEMTINAKLLMKTAIKCKNDDFLVKHLKHVNHP